MLKQEFLAQLRTGLSGLPQDDIEERLDFYSEMIDDRMEEGLSEEEAVSEIGPVDEVIAQIVAETPLARIVKERLRPKRKIKAWEIVLLVLGSPVWVPLLIAACAVVLSVYIVVWAVIVCLWAADLTLAVSAVGGVIYGAVLIFRGSFLPGIAMIGAGLACAGLAVFWFFGCMKATRGLLLLTKKIVLGIKNRFVGKEDAA